MVVATRAGCRAALFLWIFSSISCRARTALPASRKRCLCRAFLYCLSWVQLLVNKAP
uniref:Uncharacterized protein n=1 Tax=Nothoprocta perdicaria TaxID=30464 RepID=A0A8C6YNU8_NOTPE